MTRFITLLTLVATATTASAQTLPRAEITGQAAAETGHGTSLGLTPRLTLTLSERSALEVAALHRPVNNDRFGVRYGSTSGDLVLRQTLWMRDRVELFGLIGATARRRITEFPAYSYQLQSRTVDIPAFRGVETRGGAQIGVAARWAIHPRLAVRGDVRTMLGEDGALSAGIGVSIPIGRYATTGRRASLERDPVTEGLGIGAAIGGGVGAALGAVMTWLFCESDGCVDASLGVVAVGAAIGGGVGAVTGGVVDSLRTAPSSPAGPTGPTGPPVPAVPAGPASPAGWRPMVGLHYTSQGDDETHLGRGGLVAVGVSRLFGSHLRTEAELSVARHTRESGYLGATGTPIVGTVRAAGVFGRKTADVRPFASVGVHVTHSRGELRTYSNTIGPDGLYLPGPVVTRPWRVTQPGIELGTGLEMRNGRHVWRPEVRMSATFPTDSYTPGQSVLETPIIAIRAGVAFAW